MGFSKFIGRFNNFDANLIFDPEEFSRSRLSAIVNMASIDANNDQFEKTLRNSQWLDVDRYPQAIFETTQALLKSESEAVFQGLLTFHGVAAPLNINVKFNGGATNMLTQKYTFVGDTIELEIHVEFQKK